MISDIFFSVRLFDQGINMIEVADDGMGVPKDSRPFLATAHATSKISSFEEIYDPSGQQSLGFRGEALFCLANLSKNLIIATRTKDEVVAEKMEFQRDGSLRPGSLTKLTKKVGTTVTVDGLLDAVPVRRADMIRRIKDQRRKLIKLVSGYGVFSPGVKMQLLEVSQKSKDKILLATPSNSKTTGEVIGVLFGTKYLATLADFHVDISSALSQDKENDTDDENDPMQSSSNEYPSRSSSTPRGKVKGFVSKMLLGSGADRVTEHQIFSINKRPVDLPKFSRMLNDVWRTLSGHTGRSNPSCILEFQLPHDFYDINVAPDKREVFLQKESEILDCLQRFVTEFWSSQMDGHFETAADLEASPTKAEEQMQYATKPFASTETDVPSSSKRKSDNDLTDFSTVNAEMDQNEETKLDESDTIERPNNDGADFSMQESARCDLPNADQDLCAESPSASPFRNDAGRKRGKVTDRTAAEDQLWRAAKRRLHDASLSDSRQADNNAFAQFRTSSTSRSTTLIQNKSNKKNSIPSYNLERFGFQSTKDRSSAKTTTISREVMKSNIPIQRKSAKVPSFESMSHPESDNEDEHPISSDGAPSSDGEESSPDIDRGDREIEDRKVGKDDIGVEHDEESLSESHDEGSNTEPSETQESPSPKISIASPAVVWNAFEGTDAVISASRRERLAMIQRKKTLRAVQAQLQDASAEDNPEVISGSKISLQKSDFENMKVIGQFNMGFILAKSPNNHLWILDQHACDEKANFEKLVRETIIHEQPLIAPMPLELSHSEESCVVDNIDIFEKNGFRFRYEPDKPPRHRLSLTAIPHSGARDGRKAVQFGKEDVSVLCNILGADDTGTSYDAAAGSGTGADGSGLYGNNAVRRYISRADDSDRVIARLPKAIAMFASRACRGSIMIGKALSNKEMDSIVWRLSAIDHPWNCPHGRPTLRHAADLNKLIEKDIRRDYSRLAGPTVNILTQDVESSDDFADE